MIKNRVAIPALDYLLENPQILTPTPNQDCPYSRLCIPKEYLVKITQESSLRSQANYDLTSQRLAEIVQRGSQTLPNGVSVEIVKTCHRQDQVEATEAIYLPIKLNDVLRDQRALKDDIVIITCKREVELLATYHDIACCYFAPPSPGSFAEPQLSVFDNRYLQRMILGLPRVEADEQSLTAWHGEDYITTLGDSDPTDEDLALEKRMGKRTYVDVKIPGDEQPLLMRYYCCQSGERPAQLQSLRHNLSERFLAGLPGMQWQRALSDAILLPPEDAKVVICYGPTNTGKTLTAMATLIKGVPVRLSTPEDQRRKKIIFPYLLFRAEDYAQGYEWLRGLPLAPTHTDSGRINSADSQMVAFANWLTDAWYELAYLEDHAPASPIGFLNKHCEFCRFDSLVNRHVSDAYIFLDDFQNYTVAEARQLLGVAGRNSKLIILGDIEQITRPQCTVEDNGLSFVMNELVGKHPKVAYVRLTAEDRPLGAIAPLL